MRTVQDVISSKSAHVDRFCLESLPPVTEWPSLEFYGNTKLSYPERLNCATELLDKIAEAGSGDRIACYAPGGNLTYRQLLEMSNRIAHVLQDDLGMVPGNRVLLRGPNHPTMVACWFAVLKAGGVVVSTMPMLRKRELVYIAEKAKIDIALTDARFATECEQAFPEISGARLLHFNSDSEKSIEKLAKNKPSTFSNCDTSAADVAIIAFTSGTTGRSKGTMHFHRDLLAVADTFSQHVLQAGADDIFCGSPPLAFTFGLGGLLLFPMRVGASSLLLEQSTPRHLLEGIQNFHATVCFTAPTAYRGMLKLLDEFDISSLRKCVSAGETLPLATFEQWEKATGLKIIDGIGSTEMLHIFISAKESEIRPGATGKVVPGFEATLLDHAGQEVPVGEIGHLAVRGPTGCRYLDDSEQQQKYVRRGWNITGDSYLKDEDGYFWYQARTDDMIVSSGYNISGPEVENVLLGHPKVAECAVVGVPDEERGQLVKAFIVPGVGVEPNASTIKELQDFAKQEIAPYKYPRSIEFVKNLPRTETGKLQRFRLRSEAQSKTESMRNSNRIIQPDDWLRPRGYSNAISARGRYVFTSGQVGWNPATCKFETDDFAGQVRQTLMNIVRVLGAAGARPEHIVRLTWFVTDKKQYLGSLQEIGKYYREVMGTYFPTMSVIEISSLLEERALVEIEATAVVPD
jgi:2-aminobenzoate-CoA ligase